MASLHKRVKETDGMLRAVIHKLTDQIESMIITRASVDRIRVAKKLGNSLAQVHRVHRRLESSLGKLTVNFGEIDVEESDKEEPDIEKVVYGGTQGDKALSRMETKLDLLTTKFDQLAGLEALVQRSEAKIDDVLRICEILDTSQNLNVGRLVAIQHSLSEMKKGGGGSVYAGVTSTGVDPAAAQASALLSPNQPDQKKRKMDESDVFDSVALFPPQLRKDERRALTDDQRSKLRELAKRRSLMEGILDRLVPCPDGSLWDADRILDRFRSLCKSQDYQVQVATLTEYMDVKLSRSWFCARHVAIEGADKISPHGKCKYCRTWCVQIKPVEPADENEDNRYYVRWRITEPAISRQRRRLLLRMTRVGSGIWLLQEAMDGPKGLKRLQEAMFEFHVSYLPIYLGSSACY
jgi:hypothetical protein